MYDKPALVNGTIKSSALGIRLLDILLKITSLPSNMTSKAPVAWYPAKYWGRIRYVKIMIGTAFFTKRLSYQAGTRWNPINRKAPSPMTTRMIPTNWIKLTNFIKSSMIGGTGEFPPVTWPLNSGKECSNQPFTWRKFCLDPQLTQYSIWTEWAKSSCVISRGSGSMTVFFMEMASWHIFHFELLAHWASTGRRKNYEQTTTNMRSIPTPRKE